MVTDFTGLSRILRSMTIPARRHRCERCRVIFECHLCELEEEHDTHRTNYEFRVPYLCELCSVELGTYCSCGGTNGEFVERDLVTGIVLGIHLVSEAKSLESWVKNTGNGKRVKRAKVRPVTIH